MNSFLSTSGRKLGRLLENSTIFSLDFALKSDYLTEALLHFLVFDRAHLAGKMVDFA